MPELMATLNAFHEKTWDERKFFAALQGVDLDKEITDSDPLQRVAERAAERLSVNKDSLNDITGLRGGAARDAGFGIGEGLVYEVVS